MGIIIAVFWILSGLVSFITCIFLIEILFSWSVFKRPGTQSKFTPKLSLAARAAILIPAHNEEDVIAETLRSIVPQLREGDELVVVSDNCTDNTKAIASEFNVTVLERNDDQNKGKGFALDFAVSYVKGKGFDAIVMIDADCIVEPECRDRLVEETLQTARPVQCLYLMRGNQDEPSLSQKVSEFAWLIKNKLRPLGLLNFGGPCHLMGTGMAFPAPMLYNVNLATGCIVEDMQLGLDLAIAGTAPVFLPEALVWSRFPDVDELSEGQKSRWIHGHLEMITLYTPRLLKTFIVKRDVNVLLLCLELLIPPLILLLLINIAFFVSTLVLVFFTTSKLYLLALLSVLAMGVALVLAWLFEGRKVISLNELLMGLVSRLKTSSVYLKFFTDKRKDWNKTARK